MNDEAVCERLAAAVPHADWCHEADRHPDFPCACQGDREFVADALLPVVREIAAEELRNLTGDPAASTVTHTASFGLPARVVPVGTIYARADALTKPPDGPVR